MYKGLFICLLIVTLLFMPASFIRAQSLGTVPTDANFKVAFIGDSAAGNGFQSVLNLIKAEGAQMVLHQGDFDYADGPQIWMDKINTTLGASFPYFGSDGNHDNWTSDGYAAFFTDRLQKTGLGGSATNENYNIVYKGLKVVFSQEGGNPAFIQSQLAADNHIWKVCSWHKNQTTMQLGSKGDEQGWGDYETCRQYGAIVATGHEHTYERTKTLTSIQNLTVDTSQHPLAAGVPGNPNNVLVAPGKTFVFVSGLGGNGPRNQDRCLPTAYPYGGGTGCNYIWSSVYTTDQGGSSPFGALFITFNVGGNPNRATGYFKTVGGQTIDQFQITAASAGGPTATPGIPTSTPGGPSPTPDPSCTRKSQGDADCNGVINLADYDFWRREYNNELSSKTADFNVSGTVTLADYEDWRRGYQI